MKTSKILAAAALSLLAAAGAHAEIYDGVHALTSANSRAEVTAQAAVAARSANPYAEGYSSGVTTIASTRDRSSVREEAVAAAHAPNQNVRRESFAGSVIPPQFGGARISTTRQAAL